MPLKIIGAGFGRTGTMSLYTALNQLGFPCYHMIEVIGNKANRRHLDFWRRVAHSPPGTQHDWEAVFAGYAAAVDNPACCVWRELLAAYPQAKVILTTHVRGPAAWYESTTETIYFTENRWQFKVLELFTPFGRKFGDMSRRLIWQRSHRGTMNDKDAAIADYQRHIDEVKAGVPATQLLVFQADQGWKPLCHFLGVPIPETPFPNVNDRAEILRAIDKMGRGAYAILGLLGVAVVGAVWGVVRLLG